MILTVDLSVNYVQLHGSEAEAQQEGTYITGPSVSRPYSYGKVYCSNRDSGAGDFRHFGKEYIPKFRILTLI